MSLIYLYGGKFMDNGGKRLKRILGVILITGLLGACGDGQESSANGGMNESQEEVSLQMSHIGNDNHQFSLASFKFKEIIEEKSDGSIIIDIYNDGQLGTEGDNVEGIQHGTIDMTIITADSELAGVIPEYN